MDKKSLTEDYFFERGGKELRYYQRVAVQRAIRAIAQGQQRLLLVMATGTGKTFTAFQLIWRLRKAGRVQRVL
jgi:type I restriction enzyme, R subunit